ncbi:hypothetical protein Peur_011061 [Populus x canadensis]
MLDSSRACLSSLHRRAKTFLQQLRTMDRVSNCRGGKNKRLLSSSFDLLTSSFAAMEILEDCRRMTKDSDGFVGFHEFRSVMTVQASYKISK